MASLTLTIEEPTGLTQRSEVDVKDSVASLLAKIMGPNAAAAYSLVTANGSELSPWLSFSETDIIDGTHLRIASKGRSKKLKHRLFERRKSAPAARADSDIVTYPVLPCYLLVDTSVSMRDAIDQLNHEIERLWEAMRMERDLREKCWLSTIAFDTEARVTMPLTDLSQVDRPMPFAAMGEATDFEAALNLAFDRIKVDIMRLARPYRPVIFMLTDGQQTKGDYRRAVKRLNDPSTFRRKSSPNLVAFGFGNAQEEVLCDIGEKAAFFAESPEAKLSEFMNWMLSSLIESVTSSTDVSSEYGEIVDNLQLPLEDPPGGWRLLTSRTGTVG